MTRMRREFSRRSWLAVALTAAAGASCTASAARLPEKLPASAVAYQEGGDAAPVQVIYFDDYVCDDCQRFNLAAVEPLRRDWIARGRAQLTIVDLAWHRGSVAGAAAAWCAKEQGKFWPMHSLLFERQDVWKRKVDIPAQLAVYAAELGIDTAKFDRCASTKAHQRRLDDSEDAARTFAVRGTPAFVVNGKLFYGSQQWPWIEQVLLAYERGKPESAPPPPFKLPTKQVVDSVKLGALMDSVQRAGGPVDSLRQMLKRREDSLARKKK